MKASSGRGQHADRFVDAEEDTLFRQDLVKIEPFKRGLRPRRFKPRHRDRDTLLTACLEEIEQYLRRGEVDFHDAAGFQHQQAGLRRRSLKDVEHIVAETGALRNESGACNPTTATP